MIIKKLQARPGTAKSNLLSDDCITIVDKFHKHSLTNEFIQRRKSSVTVLPAFAELPPKDITKLFYNRYAVKGLKPKNSSSPQKTLGHNNI